MGLGRCPQTPRPTPPGGFLLAHEPASLPESPQASKAMTSPLTWGWVAGWGRQCDATEAMHAHEPPLWPPGGSTHRPLEPSVPLPGPSRSACRPPERARACVPHLRVPARSQCLPTALTAQARPVPVLAERRHLLGWERGDGNASACGGDLPQVGAGRGHSPK